MVVILVLKTSLRRRASGLYCYVETKGHTHGKLNPIYFSIHQSMLAAVKIWVSINTLCFDRDSCRVQLLFNVSSYNYKVVNKIIGLHCLTIL